MDNESVEPMQDDLDVFLQDYNNKRSHQGRNMEGKTPFQIFKEDLKRRKSR